VDTAALEAALADVVRGVSPVVAAKTHGIGKTRLYDEIKARRAAGVAPVPATTSPATMGPHATPNPTPVLEGMPEIGDLASLEALARQLEGELEDAPVERKASLSTTLRGVYADIRRARGPKALTPEELEAMAGPDAAEVAAKILTAVEEHEAEASAAGVCLWCRAPLGLAGQLRAVLTSGDVAAGLEALVGRLEAAAPGGPSG